LLALTSLLVATLAIFLPFTDAGTYFGFVPLPLSYLGGMVILVITYLLVVQFIKKKFYQYF
jgi:Mg2+-importing ATPase